MAISTLSTGSDRTLAFRDHRLGALGWLPWLALIMSLVATGIAMINGHWTPISDDAMITSFGVDIATDPPQLGMPTSLSVRTGTPVRHPGPLPFWLVGPFAVLFGAPGYGALIAVVATNVTVLALTAVVAAKLRPAILAPIVATFAGALLLFALGAEGAVRPFNPFFGVLATFAALVSMCSVLAGRCWALPVFVITGSLAAQSHVTFLPLIGALIFVLVLAIGLDEIRQRRKGMAANVTVRVLVISLALGGLLWLGPIIDQVAGTGNLMALLRGSDSTDGAGWTYGLERLVDAVAPRPLWTTEAAGGSLPAPSAVRWILAALILLALVVLAVRAVRSRHRTILSLTATALTAALAATAISSRIPADARALASPSNRLFWWPVGAVVWFAIAGSAAIVATNHIDETWTPKAGRGRRFTHGVAIVALLACTWLGSQVVRDASASESGGSILFGAARLHAQAIDDITPPGGTVRLQAPNAAIDNYVLTQSLIAQLRLRGKDVQVDIFEDPWGHFQAYRDVHPIDGPADVTVFVQGSPGSQPPSSGSQLLSAYDPAQPPEEFRGYNRGVLLGGRQLSRIYEVKSTSSPPATPSDLDESSR